MKTMFELLRGQMNRLQEKGASENAEQMSAPRRMVVVALVLIILSNSLLGCNLNLAPTATAGLSRSTASPTATVQPTPTNLPTLRAAVQSSPGPIPGTETAPAGPSPTPSQTSAPTFTATTTPSATSMPTHTPSVSPSFTPGATAIVPQTFESPTPTITPTKTITPTPTPTLTPTPLFTPTPMPTQTFSEDVVHFLLMGLDSTRNLGGQNTDVIMIAAVNKGTKQVSLLSIPRDLWVYIPTYGWSRINVAHKMGHRNGYPGGGPGLLGDTILVNFGIPIDHWVRLDFQGFARVVDELGGVEMTVACPVNLRYEAPTSEDQEEEILEPGVYHMDGETALRYVRTRRGGSDFDRARRQQQFLKVMWQQVKSPDLLLKIPGLWSALSGSFQTDLSVGDALSLAPVALALQPQRIRSRYINNNHTTDWTTSEGWQVLLPQYDKIQQVVASLYAPPSAYTDHVANEGARVQVRNGTYRHQLALIAADQLRWYGLEVVDTGLADSPDYVQTRIMVYSDKPKTLELLADVLKVKQENIILQPDPNAPAEFQVILGDDYDPCH